MYVTLKAGVKLRLESGAVMGQSVRTFMLVIMFLQAVEVSGKSLISVFILFVIMKW